MPGTAAHRELVFPAVLAALLHLALFYLPAGHFRKTSSFHARGTITLAVGSRARVEERGPGPAKKAPAPRPEPPPGVEEKKPAPALPEPEPPEPQPLKPEPEPPKPEPSAEKPEPPEPKPLEPEPLEKKVTPSPPEAPVESRPDAAATGRGAEATSPGPAGAEKGAVRDGTTEAGGETGKHMAAAAAPGGKEGPPGEDAAKETLTLARPDYLKNPRPGYPRVALRRGLEGTAVLRVVVSREGEPLSVTLKESSGHDTLDRAALDAVEDWVFIPAKRGDEPVESRVEVPVTFRLAR